MKLKICGMKYNPTEVAALQPDYLGFIFYQDSKRNFIGQVPKLPKNIKKAGVFVDAPLDFLIEKTLENTLDVIQLHGDESPEYIKAIRNTLQSDIAIWKVFSIKDTFNFNCLKMYEGDVNAFLFDTKGKEKGGNGHTFNWNALKEYPSQIPLILSGGIGLEEISAVKKLRKTKVPLMAIDVNSKFEIKPGLKDIPALEKLKKQLS